MYPSYNGSPYNGRNYNSNFYGSGGAQPAMYSGTITGLRISGVDGGATASGGAFIDNAGATIPTFADGNHQIEIYDSAGRMIKGALKAVGTGGTVGTDVGSVFTDWTGAVPTGWSQLGTPDASNYTEQAPAGQFHIVSNGTFIGIQKASIVTIGALYKNTVDIIAITGMVSVGLTNHVIGLNAVGNNKVSYFTATISNAGILRNGGALDATLDNWKLEPVLAPSSSGSTIVSAKGGVTYNFTSKDASFAYNSASYAVVVRRLR
jgi:hypothetical protein